MSRSRLVPVLVLLLCAAGCQALDGLLSGVTKPSVRVASVRIQDLTVRDLTLGLLLEVENPYSVPLPVLGLRYGLLSGGKTFLDGTSDEERLIPAYGKGDVPLTARLPFSGVLAVLQGVRPGSVFPYEAEIGLFVNAPALSRLELPLRHQGELPVPAIPEVGIDGIRWDDLSLSRVAGTISLGIRNTNEFPVDLSSLDFGLRLAGVDVGRAGGARALPFAAGARQTLDLPISFSPTQGALALLSALGGSGADYSLTGGLRAGTPFGPIEFPISGAGKARTTR